VRNPVARFALVGESAGARLDEARLGMLIFLGAEAMLFAGFIAAFLVFRLGAPVWPPPFQPRLPIGITGVNTAVLLASGYTMSRALAALGLWDRGELRRRLGQTTLLGAGFLGLQGYEWLRILHFGLTTESGVYGSLFYTLIGAHGVHVASALAWLGVLLAGFRAERLAPRLATRLSVLGMYWYFVVGLWPILYVLVYLT
jgi:cytochrome c oxidase subunit 3